MNSLFISGFGKLKQTNKQTNTGIVRILFASLSQTLCGHVALKGTPTDTNYNPSITEITVPLIQGLMREIEAVVNRAAVTGCTGRDHESNKKPESDFRADPQAAGSSSK